MPHSTATISPHRNASAEPLSEADRKAFALLEDMLCTIAVNSGGESRGRFALAYSGGMDSRFLAHAAVLLGFQPFLLMAVGPQLPPEEEAFGRLWAEKNGLQLRSVEVDPLSLPLVAVNDRRRCYECKREIFGTFLRLLNEESSPLPLCDGTNASDALTYRPGTQAVRELGVHSPLALAGLSKADIYRLAALSGMERPNQKPRPCLLTRLPYGIRPERKTLEGLAAAEQAVRLALEDTGISEADFRLRLVPRADGLNTELHLLRKEAQELPPGLLEDLTRLAENAAPQLPRPARFALQDSLSGFFDRLQPLTTS